LERPLKDKIMNAYTIPFSQINLTRLQQVGGKNASLGEILNKLRSLRIEVPGGFAVTVESTREFLTHNKLTETPKQLLNTIDCKSLSTLPKAALQCRTLVTNAVLPNEVKNEKIKAYHLLSGNLNNLSVVVRSSATAEDLHTASFAEQHDSLLNTRDKENLLSAVHKCYVSLFNDRAIKYPIDNGFEHMELGFSVFVQYMVRLDEGCAGIILAIDPESGFENAMYVTVARSLGELGTLAGKEGLNIERVDDVARESIDKGKCDVVVVSMGAAGAMLATRDLAIHIMPPEVKIKSTEGAGYSMVTGIVLSLAQNKSIEEAAQYGVACGTAATMNTSTELYRKEDANHLYKLIQVNKFKKCISP